MPLLPHELYLETRFQSERLTPLNHATQDPIELLLQGEDANPDEIEQVFRIELVSPNGTVIDVTPQRSAIESIPGPD